MNCIFCQEEAGKSSVEHIVSHSLGNNNYILKDGEVCTPCNGIFSKFEQDVLRDSFIAFLRVKHAIKTKKGNPAFFSHDGFTMRGSTDFKKDSILFNGMEKLENVTFNPATGASTVTILDCDRTAASNAKMLLKIGFESLYKSQPSTFSQYQLNELRDYLLKKTIKDWPFIRTHFPHSGFKSIPRFNDRYLLRIMKCKLEYLEMNDNLVFHFVYHEASYYINLINRNTDWITNFVERDHMTSAYPHYLTTRLNPHISISPANGTSQ